MTLTPTQQKFILHWGEMGTRWGINRTVAQIHALLFIRGTPVPADEIATTLSVARSNVSTSLRELQAWGLVKVVHVLGDRRDHFETLSDVWAMFKLVLQERKRREIDPTLALLREAATQAKKESEVGTSEKLMHMLEFFETAMLGYEEVMKLSPAALKRAVKYGSKIQRLLGVVS
ncbi:MAG: MarR family transcriptional regulator [Candidatus Brocadiae bacterium]|nr:MarR family transcriptional regulator [Candidatus Brocadiia bacterium]